MKRTHMATGIGAALVASSFGLTSLMAQQHERPERPQSAIPSATQSDEGREVTLTGRIVDLHAFMTEGAAAGTRNPAITGQTARQPGSAAGAGDIKAMVSNHGLVILGNCDGPMRSADKDRTARPGAADPQNSAGEAAGDGKLYEVKGKLYEKSGIKYVDVTSVTQNR